MGASITAREMPPVVQTVITESSCPLGKEPRQWTVLIWPDGVWTDLAGYVVIYTHDGRVMPMCTPFYGRRPLLGIRVVMNGMQGGGLMWTSLRGKDYFPHYPSPDGKDHYFRVGSDDRLPANPNPTMGIYDEAGVRYFIKECSFWPQIEVDEKWMYVGYEPRPHKGALLYVMYNDEIRVCEIVAVDPVTSEVSYSLGEGIFTVGWNDYQQTLIRGVFATREVVGLWGIQRHNMK